MSNVISNTMEVIDSRDIIERIQELDILISGESSNEDLKSFIEEYDSLVSLQEECGDYVDDWEYGVSLIRDSYFTEYCRELVTDCGYIPSDLPWYIADHIDWEGVAREVRVDYTEVVFDGVTYFIR